MSHLLKLKKFYTFSVLIVNLIVLIAILMSFWSALNISPCFRVFIVSFKQVLWGQKYSCQSLCYSLKTAARNILVMIVIL